jgi:Flp pilus assembly CpaF family ATPase
MGVVFDKSLYANISKLYGLREQRNDEFLGIVNREDENVDISIDDIVALYERRLKEGKRVERTTPPINIAPLVDESVKSL